jgi:acetyltransferase-like isoleucine patch superfamily enzyme
MRNIRNIPRGISRRMGHVMDKAPPWVRTLGQKCTNLLHVEVFDSGTNNHLTMAIGTHRKIEVVFMGSGNTVEVGIDSILSNLSISISGSNNVVSVGERAEIYGGSLQVFGDNSTVELGADTWMANAFIYVTDSNSAVSVGNGTFLGPSCELRCGDGHAIYDLSSGEILNRAHQLKIGKNVWAGAGVSFLKDVIVGDGAIIGTRSVITKAIPERCLVVGVPAKVIRRNVGWTRQRVDALPNDWFEREK